MSKDDPFGDAVKRALNRDPWAIPGKVEVAAVEAAPADVGHWTRRAADGKWGEACPRCKKGWMYWGEMINETETMRCHGVALNFEPYSIAKGCGLVMLVEG